MPVSAAIRAPEAACIGSNTTTTETVSRMRARFRKGAMVTLGVESDSGGEPPERTNGAVRRAGKGITHRPTGWPLPASALGRAAAVLLEFLEERLQFLTLGLLVEVQVGGFARVVCQIVELARRLGFRFRKGVFLQLALVVVSAGTLVVEVFPVSLADLELPAEALGQQVRAGSACRRPACRASPAACRSCPSPRRREARSRRPTRGSRRCRWCWSSGRRPGRRGSVPASGR